jgi:hypothetical protein
MRFSILGAALIFTILFLHYTKTPLIITHYNGYEGLSVIHRRIYASHDNMMVVSWNTLHPYPPTLTSCVHVSIQEKDSRTSSKGRRSRHSAPPYNRPMLILHEQPSSSSSSFSSVYKGGNVAFIEPSTNKTTMYHHQVKIPPLPLSSSYDYQYRCGMCPQDTNDEDSPLSPSSWVTLKPLFFTPSPRDKDLNLIIYGDMGVSKSKTWPFIKQELSNNTKNTDYDAVIHVGDLGYDLHELNGRRANQFSELIEPVAASMAYMTTPGNHEAAYNFTHYTGLFDDRLYYSIDLGTGRSSGIGGTTASNQSSLLHAVFFNSELFFWPDYYSQPHIDAALYWLEKDLSSSASRESTWRMFITHRPMYCYALPCDWEYEAMRGGIASDCGPSGNPRACRPVHNREGKEGNSSTVSSSHSIKLENLLQKYKVNIVIAGHQHSYYRTVPVFNHTIMTGSSSSSFVAPIHVVTGAGGNKEMQDKVSPAAAGPCPDDDAPYCAWQSGTVHHDGEGSDFTYSRVKVSGDELWWEQVSTSRGDSDVIVDKWMLRR